MRYAVDNLISAAIYAILRVFIFFFFSVVFAHTDSIIEHLRKAGRTDEDHSQAEKE